MLEQWCHSRNEALPDKSSSGQGSENRSSPCFEAIGRYRFRWLAESGPLSQLLAEVETAKGRKRLESTLARRPYPHYRPVPGQPDLICRIEEDGTEVVGRFVGRDFVAEESRS